jgi:hypothetical protein
MAFELDIFGDGDLQGDFVDWLVDEKSADVSKHFSRLWDYYANQMMECAGLETAAKVNAAGRYYLQAQEYGLPARITGVVHSANTGMFDGRNISDIERKEVVVENDISWRINAGVDFLFGKPISFVSRSPDANNRSRIESILKAVFAANGGIGFLQDMAVLGSVYGFVDCLVRPGEKITEHTLTGSHSALSLRDATGTSEPPRFEDVLKTAQTIYLELIEAPRALPVLDENDYRRIVYYVQHFWQKKNELNERSGFLSRLFGRNKGGADNRRCVSVTEIISSEAIARYEDKQLVRQGRLPWGFLPVVHIQNMAQPFYYEGVSDVEPLIPLQDELNTRLSDRASRITFQSFKMYLGKGVEGFGDRPVSPGRMWQTDNPDATIEEFGGDSAAPSEDRHIAEIREAMDKTSSVTPLAAGILKGKVGNLTSAVALRLTLMGMLSKTERKRFTYGEGLKRICGMILSILDKAGIYRTSEADREVEIIFPSPLPENTMERLKEAQIKKELGVPTEQVLRELGYETTREGV